MQNKLFLYRVKTLHGNILTGKMYSDSTLEANKFLQQLDGCVINIIDITWVSKIGFSKLQLSDKNKLNLFNDLYTLCSAGVNLIDSLKSIDESNYLEYSLKYTIQLIEQGNSLSLALKSSGIITNNLILSFINNAEKHGNYTKEFKNIVNHLNWWIIFKKNIKKTLSYPIALLIINFALVWLLLSLVVPNLCELYSGLNKQIPDATRALLIVSQYFEYIIFAICFIISLVFIVVLSFNQYPILFGAQKQNIINVIIAFPWLGKRLQEIVLLQYFKNLHAISSADITLVFNYQ